MKRKRTCSHKCWNAKGKVCRCICGGRNHGNLTISQATIFPHFEGSFPQLIQNDSMKIQNGYKQWIETPERKFSREIDFGCWWGLHQRKYPWWRVSWIERTGELYAVNLSNLNEYIILDNFKTKEEVEIRMKGYCESFSNMILTRYVKKGIYHT